MLTSGGAAVPRLGVPALGSAKALTAWEAGAFPAANRPANSSSWLSNHIPCWPRAGPLSTVPCGATLAKIGLEARG